MLDLVSPSCETSRECEADWARANYHNVVLFHHLGVGKDQKKYRCTANEKIDKKSITKQDVDDCCGCRKKEEEQLGLRHDGKDSQLSYSSKLEDP